MPIADKNFINMQSNKFNEKLFKSFILPKFGSYPLFYLTDLKLLNGLSTYAIYIIILLSIH